MRMPQRKLRFDDVFNETVDEVIKNVFEDKAAKSILGHFTASNSEELDEKVKFLTDSLPKILGAGFVIIEDLILETLYLKYGRDLKRRKGYGFRNYIMELRDRTGEKPYEAQLSPVR